MNVQLISEYYSDDQKAVASVQKVGTGFLLECFIDGKLIMRDSGKGHSRLQILAEDFVSDYKSWDKKELLNE